MYRRVMYTIIGESEVLNPGNWRVAVRVLLRRWICAAVQQAVAIPVLRPLIGSDKQEIASAVPKTSIHLISQRRRLLIAAHCLCLMG